MLLFVLAAKYQTPFYLSCYCCNKSAHGVGTSKEGPVLFYEFLSSLICSSCWKATNSFLLAWVLIVSPRVIMTSINPSSILRDHLYSIDDRLKRGRPPPLLKSQPRKQLHKGWSEWVDRGLRDPSICDILSRAGVLDAIFISKACDIHIEAKMLRHVVRRWSTETHTFICSWGEFAPTVEDVANIFHLPLCGSQDPFHITEGCPDFS
ncbi:unnamed protein product [Prunus brigantina]